MYPRAFDYAAPRSKEEALEILAERGDEAKVLAGGQSLIPMMKLRLAGPAMLVDINNIPGLNAIDVVNGHLRVQALARHANIVASDVVKVENHAMASCAPWVSDPIVRNRGTLCGSVAHHDPEGDWASVMLAVDAEVVVESRDGGRRTIHITDFLVDMFTTSIAPNELLTEVHIPRYTRGGGNYQKLERKVGDYATVGVATQLVLDDNGAIAEAGIGLTSVAAYNMKAAEAEALLVGNAPSTELFAEAARTAAAGCDPSSDVRGSAEYKRDVVRVFTERGLAASLAIAQGS
jgi:carbon-monoxide dehydrogenase medium subunit